MRMRTTPTVAGLCASICLLAGCADGESTGQGKSTEVEVVQVTTLTTVQASSGSYLSPKPEQELPPFVERGQAQPPLAFTDPSERAKLDVALLFRENAVDANVWRLDARVGLPSDTASTAVDNFFPAIRAADDGATWPLELTRSVQSPGRISEEWGGWRDFDGLGVRPRGDAAQAAAPLASLAFESAKLSAPLQWHVDGSDVVLLNVSDRIIERALLVYSHAGGIGVTAVSNFGPGSQALTTLGPKEHTPDVLLQLARESLHDFFAARVSEELATAMTRAKSLPFLETHGLRLIALLEDGTEPVPISFASPVASEQHVLVSHAELISSEDEMAALAVVADPNVDATAAASMLGRFTEAKLELTAQNGDATVRERALALLEELRSR
jgi:hypothetical protein